MATKTQTSTASLKTLKGVFEQPKMQHRRDFLRENKLSLRELQKNTSQKLTQQKQEHDNRQYKHLQKYHKTQEPALARRSISQSRNVEQHCNRQSRRTAGFNDGGGEAVAPTKVNPNYLDCKRANSQQQRKVENLQDGSKFCCIPQKAQNSETQSGVCVPRSASSVSALSKAGSCDKEIQTEDIHDEDFLHKALKKCSSSEINLLYKPKSVDQLSDRDNNLQQAHSNYGLQHYESKLNSIHSNERVGHVSQYREEDTKPQHDQISQQSVRSQNTRISNGDYHTQEGEVQKIQNEDLYQDFANLKLAEDKRREQEPPSSARSRNTLCSTSSKRSVYTLGGREDVRLPRYLEKEKREKEEERIRELSKDLNCPSGHYALSEEDRLKSLNKAQEKMASLISELNHMPMTMETLRIRNRKVQIEKELTQIEFDIRLYSKPKVYMPKTNPQY